MRFLKRREVASLVLKSNLVLEVVEARNPLDTRGRLLERVAANLGRELVILLNKSDLVPRRVCAQWVEYFNGLGYKALCTSASTGYGIKKLMKFLRERGKDREVVALIAGYPKVGKSSIINALKGCSSAPTSPYPGTPGYTKGVTLYKVAPGVYIIDTPGVLPPEGESLEALVRRQPVENLRDPVNVALKILSMLLERNPRSVRIAYGIEARDPMEILTRIAVSRGWLYKTTKEPNVEEASRTVIRDFLNGKLRYYVLPPAMPEGSRES